MVGAIDRQADCRIRGPVTKARKFLPLIEQVELQLDEHFVRGALHEAEGNITKAAELLGVRSDRLRAYVLSKPELKLRQDEVIERGVDRAIEILHEGMDKDRPYPDRLAASKEFLKTAAAGRRGFRANSQTLEIKASGSGRTPILIRWDEGEAQGPIIEGEKS